MMKIEEVLSLVRPHLLTLEPYSSARDEFDQSNVDKDQFIYLDANENPFDNGSNRYPDPYQHELKKKISEIKSVNHDQIFLGNGSDEAIDLIIRLFCNENDTILIPYPTYGMYEVSAKINNVKLKKFLLDDNFALTPLSEEGKIIFLCSPNNPSGNLLDVEPILKSFKGIVVIDEAYIDFTNHPGFLKKIDEYPNLIVLQTFSKAWGLAGLRLGMAFANTAIISLINKIKPPYNISSATQKLAAQAFTKIEDVKKMVVLIKGERERVAKELTKLTSVRKVFPSEANFVLVRIANAGSVYAKLINDHIVVRDRSKVQRCEDCLRITIGTADENNKLLEALLKYS
jgi:histidinol-phosphate aminotransferase